MIPLFSPSQIREADNYAIKKLGIPGIALMENASRSLIEAIERNINELNHYLPIGIICGKGNNGGDGYALARQLMIRGYPVKLISLAHESELSGDALVNYRIFKKLIISYKNSDHIQFNSVRDINKLKDCQLIIDALLGTGTRGDLKEPYSSIIEKLNEIIAYKVAVDIPSGLQPDTSVGNIIFDADLTVTMAELKTGLFYGKGYLYAGKVIKGTIGIGSEYFDRLKVEAYLTEPEDCFSGLPMRKKDANKYSAGKVLIIAGSGMLPGAAALAANAALNSGAGAVVLAFPYISKQIIHQKICEATVITYNDGSKEYLTPEAVDQIAPNIKWADSIVVGPGLGRKSETVSALHKLFEKYSNKKFIIDADAVFALSEGFYKKISLMNSVFTPHHGEFANLMGISIEELHQNLLSLGRKFSRSSNSILVLKGAPTIIFHPDGEIIINSSGNEALAKFGSGDVLAGIIGSFIACNKEVELSAISAVYLHGLIADLLVESKSELSVSATDLINNISDTIKFVEKSIV
ncbi:MAG: NAD(P)H-hydrate dehydratase [Melioribacteraceae bacterium]|nr:NAD(P)H-hydrate dehydratase [Melioribacteraceae bacterium]